MPQGLENETKNESASETKKKEAVTSVKKTKISKKIRAVSVGCAFIQATYNNTIVTIADNNGETLAWSSAGHLGFKGPKKATPFAATLIVKDVVEKTRAYNLRDVHVIVKGVGSGREASIRALNTNGLNILSIKDKTPLPHNGPRPPKSRRV